jgi:hypothetical protein
MTKMRNSMAKRKPPTSQFGYSLPDGSNADQAEHRRKKKRRIAKRIKAEEFAQSLANRLRKSYIVQRRLYESNRDGTLSTYMPSRRDLRTPSVEDSEVKDVFMVQAKKLYQQGIGPEEYVEKVFAQLVGKVTSCPRPSQLTSARCMALYRDANKTLKEDIQRAFTIQRKVARRAIVVKCNVDKSSVEDAMNETIRDESLPLSALFRYCLALSKDAQKVKRLAERYYILAAVQYYPKRDIYDQVWGECIPDDFREDAATIYEGIAQQMV